LLAREGRRERNRVRSRLHVISRTLVETAASRRAAIALEDLTRLSTPRRRGPQSLSKDAPRSPKLRRRLSSWPRRELHRQIAYKTGERGVPIYWVNPFRTSITCPRCGEIVRPRSRVGPVFACPSCNWSMDRQLNAGVNIGRIVLRDHGRAELGGLRLDLDVLSKEAMTPLYPFEKSDGQGRSGRRGRDMIEPPGDRGSSN
jgi:putative transposase